MAPDRTCSETKADGTPCGAPPNLVDPETGFCPSHDPENRERLREAARKGAKATARKLRGGGLEKEELPPLDSPQAAERWCELVAVAVATSRISHNAGRTLARLIREFLRSHEAGEVTDQVEELKDKVARLKGGDLKALK